MSSSKFIIHLIILLIVQLAIFDNIQLHSYVYINIYIFAIYILPYRLKGIPMLLFGFFLGFLIDIANNTIGIHAASTTLIAYIRPRLLLLTSNREQIDDIHGKQNINEVGWMVKYMLISTIIFNTALIFLEAFSFKNITVTLLRILFSAITSTLFILLYYFIAFKKKVN